MITRQGVLYLSAPEWAAREAYASSHVRKLAKWGCIPGARRDATKHWWVPEHVTRDDVTYPRGVNAPPGLDVLLPHDPTPEQVAEAERELERRMAEPLPPSAIKLEGDYWMIDTPRSVVYVPRALAPEVTEAFKVKPYVVE